MKGLKMLLMLSCPCMVEGMDDVQFQQMIEQMSSGAQTQASLMGRLDQLASAIASQAAATASSSSSTGAGGLPDLSRSLEGAAKVLKNPEAFDPETMSWTTWRHSFTTWLGFARADLVDKLKQIEKLGQTAIDMTGASDAELDASSK